MRRWVTRRDAEQKMEENPAPADRGAGRATMKAKFFVPSKPRDVYEAVAVELLKGELRVVRAREFPQFCELDHPRPEA